KWTRQRYWITSNRWTRGLTSRSKANQSAGELDKEVHGENRSIICSGPCLRSIAVCVHRSEIGPGFRGGSACDWTVRHRYRPDGEVGETGRRLLHLRQR